MKSGEFDRIARYLAPLAAGVPGAFNLTDDAAVISPEPGRDFVVTTDTVVAGVHFVGDEAPGAIAAKLLRVNLSDLAAMGAEPLVYTLNIALPPEIDDAWLSEFVDGLYADQKEFEIDLAGGDSVTTPGPVTLTVTALGSVATGQALLRSGAGAGQSIFVTGTIGDAALGLRSLDGGLDFLNDAARQYLIRRYRYPEPRIRFAARLAGLAAAAVDVSDGLVADLGHIATASGVGAIVDATRLPLSPAAARCVEQQPELLGVCLGGGDDYELVITAPDRVRADLAVLAAELTVPITEIGRIVDGAGVRVVGADGREIPIRLAGWEHE